MFPISKRDLRNQVAQRDNSPRCGNCSQLERRIKELEEQFEEAHRLHVACLKQLRGVE